MQRKVITRTLSAVAISGMLVIGVGACSKASDKLSDKVAEKAVEAAGGGDVDIDSDGDDISIKTKDGEFSSKSTKKLPADWPSDFLGVPEGFTIANVTQTKTADGAMSIVYLEGKGDVDAILDSYIEGFEAKGLEVPMQTKSGEGGMVIATDADAQLNYHVTASADDDGSVTLMLSTSTEMA